MKYLNLGCGRRFQPDWTNIDLTSTSEYVIAHDLTKSIPSSDSYFDVVYHSHLLEHFSKQQASNFMQECYRVLKFGGIIRVVVPDLERITRTYLYALEKALRAEKGWKDNYEWMMLELYDQTVRNYPGGAMREYFKKNQIPNKAFVKERIGVEALNQIKALQRNRTLRKKTKGPKIKIGIRIRQFPKLLRAALIKCLLLESDYEALRVGRFRSSGETHQWMYDRFSLARLMEKAGFKNVSPKSAYESGVENWVHFNLDSETDGSEYKPDSLYMEASKYKK